MTPESSALVRRVIRTASIVGGLALVAALVVFEGRVLLLLLGGVLLALSLQGTSAALSRATRLPYGVALGIVTVLLFGGLAAGAYAFWARAFEQAQALGQEVPRAWHSFVHDVRVEPIVQEVTGGKDVSLQPSAAEAEKLLGGARAALGGATELLAGLIVLVFLGIYGAAQPRVYADVALRLVPPKHRARVREVLGETAHQLTHWMLGRLVAMAFVGLVAGVGLWLLHVPLAAPLGVLAGLLTFVEYVGAVASAAPACLLAFAAGPSHVAGVALLYTAAHVVEGYGLTPMLTRRTVHIPPGFTLAAQALLGTLFGVAGLTLATPVLIVLSVPVKRFYVEGALGDREGHPPAPPSRGGGARPLAAA